MDGFEVIHSYSRAQALADGVLVDVSAAAKKIGFKYPVAVTESLYEQYIVVPESFQDSEQSEEGRLHDVLSLLAMNIKASKGLSNELHYSVQFRMPGSRNENVQVWALVNGGDTGEPVITIMLEGED